MERDDEQDYVNMLLDIDMFHGSTEKRLGPTLTYLVVAGIPCLLYVYYLIMLIPMWAFAIFEVLWAIRWALYILGEEPRRLEGFKRQMSGQYSTTRELLNIKRIHKDGCVEYMDGRVAYFVVTDNGSSTDLNDKIRSTRQFINDMTGERFIPDIYIQNVSMAESLTERYSKVKFFNSKETMKDFIKIIDYNIQFVDDNSLLTRVVYVMTARRKEFKELKATVEGAIKSKEAKVFHDVRIADKALAEKIISRDCDTFIDYNELMTDKYATGRYDGSKVVGYDMSFDELLSPNSEETDIEKERGFILDD